MHQELEPAGGHVSIQWLDQPDDITTGTTPQSDGRDYVLWAASLQRMHHDSVLANHNGRKRLAAELQGKSDSCGTDVLRTLHSVRPSDDLIPVVTKALDSPNFGVAQSAAPYLGDHVPAAAEDALLRRLEELWNGWQGRSSELPDDMMSLGTDIKEQTAMLERALASALAHAANWKLGPRNSIVYAPAASRNHVGTSLTERFVPATWSIAQRAGHVAAAKLSGNLLRTNHARQSLWKVAAAKIDPA